MGTPDFAAVSLKCVLDAGYEVAGVFTQPDRPVGRRQRLTAPPVKGLALERGIRVYQPTKLRDGTAAQIIRSLDPQVIAVVAYGRLLPREILEIPPLGCVNIHGSLLPKYRGAAPMAEAMDAGDVIGAVKTPIYPEETAGELFERLAPMGGALLCETLCALEAGTVTRIPQKESQATFAPPLTKEMAELDFNVPGRSVVDRIRGLDPWPVATAVINGEKCKIFKAFSTKKAVDAPPGRVISAGKAGIEIAAADGSVTVTEIQAPGGKRMSAADYLRGHPLCL